MGDKLMDTSNFVRIAATLGIFAVLAGGLGWLASKSSDRKASRKHDSKDARAADTPDP